MKRRIYRGLFTASSFVVIIAMVHSCIGTEQRYVSTQTTRQIADQYQSQQRNQYNDRLRQEEERRRRIEEEHRRIEEERRRQEEERRRREEEERRKREEEERRRKEEERRRRFHSEADFYVRRVALLFSQRVMEEVNPKHAQDPSYRPLSHIDADDVNFIYRTMVALTWTGRSDRFMADYRKCEVEGDLIIYLHQKVAEFVPTGHSENMSAIFSYYGTKLRPFYEVQLNAQQNNSR